MGISLGKGLLIAAGLGAVGVGGYMLLKNHNQPADGAADGSSDPNAAGGDTSLTGPPTGTTMAPTTTMGGTGLGSDPTGAANSMPATGTTSTAPAAGRQVGPYTVMDDPQTGMSLVIETATQQPVGVLDDQGNMIPVTVDANGQLQIVQDQTSAAALGQGTTASGTNMAPTAGANVGGASSSGYDAATKQEAYAQIAADLFANAGNATAGSAASDAMTGATTVSGAGTTTGGYGSTGASAPIGATAPTGPGATVGGTGASALASSNGVQTRQVGEFTIVDDGSGVSVILDTASQQPVGMMDAAGNVTPISVDANGNIQVTGPSSGSTSGAPAPAAAGGMSSSTNAIGAMPSGTAPSTAGSFAATGSGY